MKNNTYITQFIICMTWRILNFFLINLIENYKFTFAYKKNKKINKQ